MVERDGKMSYVTVRKDPPGQLSYRDLNRNGYDLRRLTMLGLAGLAALGLWYKDDIRDFASVLARFESSPAMVYQVQPGDKIDYFGAAEGLTPREIRVYRIFTGNENGVSDPDRIKEGQKLILRDFNGDGKVGKSK